MNKINCLKLVIGCMAALGCCASPQGQPKERQRPNILFVIADDQSYPHASAYGAAVFRTPAFDSIAKQGVLFTRAFVAAPQCSPSRAAILTGRNIWQLGEAGTHSSYFPRDIPVFTDALVSVGYFTGYTGKAWGPGNWQDAGWPHNPVGAEYNREQYEAVPYKGVSRNDYPRNFERFLEAKPADQPFFFWFGCHEPHRGYEYGSGQKQGLDPDSIDLPPFLPDHDTIRTDMLDYALEISWFDQQLQQMLALLERRGQLENTIVIVTADNGMAFPHAKASLYTYGIHVPLAICGPGISGGNRHVDDLVSLIDIAPTMLEYAGAAPLPHIPGKSLRPLLEHGASGIIDTGRQYVLAGRERHTHARPDNLGYPSRALRTHDYLYIRNLKPDRWPMGDPPPLQVTDMDLDQDMSPIVHGFEDIDGSPTKGFLLKRRAQWPALDALLFGKRLSEELYAVKTDPACLRNLAADSAHRQILASLRNKLEQQLIAEGDPRMTTGSEVFDGYPRFGKMRPFPGFREEGTYNPAYKRNE